VGKSDGYDVYAGWEGAVSGVLLEEVLDGAAQGGLLRGADRSLRGRRSVGRNRAHLYEGEFALVPGDEVYFVGAAAPVLEKQPVPLGAQVSGG